MSAREYEQLLGELDAARRADSADTDEELAELNAGLAVGEERLLQQQADLLRAARTLRLRAPRLRPDAQDATDDVSDPAAALRRLEQHADYCDAAINSAVDAAGRPSYLPHQRRIVRHLAVYTWCALAAAALESLLVLTQGFMAVAWVFAAAPLAAFCVGFVVIGQVSRPRLSPAGRKARRAQLPTRHPRHGAMLCLVVSAITAIWWLLL